tara:strand:- start:1942 stop:2406 length:465 start_codon:yes stop_codon:yes gene_type:complete
MNKRYLSTVLAFVIAFCGVNTSVFAAAHAKDEDHHDHTELEDNMETISKAFRALRRQAKDPAKNKASAALAAKMLAAAKSSIDLEPKWTADQPKDEQVDFLAGYKIEMEATVELLAQLVTAFEGGDNSTAGDVIAKLRDAQKKGHKGYKEPDED